MLVNSTSPSRCVVLVCMGFLLAVSAGCSRLGSDRPTTVPVSGIVTYNGTPVEGAIVTFRNGGQTKPAVGTTDASGRFQLSSYDEGDGAAPGTYTVTVIKMPATAADQGDTSMEAAAEKQEDLVSAEVEHLLPARYASPLQSGLEETVTDGGPNEFKIELTD